MREKRWKQGEKEGEGLTEGTLTLSLLGLISLKTDINDRATVRCRKKRCLR